MNNLLIDAPLRNIKIGSDAVFHGAIDVGPQSRLVILPGNMVYIQP
jgi:hypothetical protein